MQIGRIEIFTDELNIDESNIVSVVQKAMPYHETNRQRMDYLLSFEAGKQPLNRKKEVRPEINVIDIDNLAHYITDFKCGYFWGNPITFVQRGVEDNGKKTESKAIALLNESYESINIRKKTQELARFVEICGIGYTFAEINQEWEEGDSFFRVETLDPRYAFVIKSSYYADHRVMVGVSYYQDEQGSRHYTAYTKNGRYDLDELVLMTNTGRIKKREGTPVTAWTSDSAYLNPLGIVPIVEWERSPDRMGCFERQLDELNYLNLLLSNVGNQQEDETQCVWWTNDVEFPLDENGNPITPKTNDWVSTYTSRDGKTPKITPLTSPHDYASQLNVINATRARILEECHVPGRNETSGGSTGIAMADASGWSDAEVDAYKEQMTVEACKMNELKVVCAAIKKSPDIESDNPLLDLKYSDAQPNMKRAKSYELTVKSNTLATLLSHGIAPEHAIRVVNLFDDPQQVLEDSKENLERYFDREFGSGEEETPQNPIKDKMMADYSDQITNSPNIDGLSTEKTDEETDEEG